MVIDDAWSLIGSANWDTRSFRLNFELNVELHDPTSPVKVAAIAPAARPLTLAELDARPAADPAAQQRRPAAAAVSLSSSSYSSRVIRGRVGRGEPQTRSRRFQI